MILPSKPAEAASWPGWSRRILARAGGLPSSGGICGLAWDRGRPAIVRCLRFRAPRGATEPLARYNTLWDGTAEDENLLKKTISSRRAYHNYWSPSRQ
ncbi:hypothetical protein DPMN_122661 [Dreissena polymorpha]|uniref:Uncharacterized protein n=1 Tax=Dreissena polymorpha TaxID=45954 RepID=A0A9D4JUP5_DREPO|nr:hypothetical protein DPMN_122661 [Dreissena polymorpha]